MDNSPYGHDGLGLLITAVIILAIFLNGWRIAKAQAVSAEDKFTILALLAGLVAFLTDSIFSFPLHIPASSLALVVLLAILDSGYLAKGQRSEFKLGRYSKLALASIFIILAFTVSSLAIKDFIGDLYLVKGEKLAKEKQTEAQSYLKKSIELGFDGGERLSISVWSICSRRILRRLRSSSKGLWTPSLT